MKEVKRAAVAAELLNHPAGYLVLKVLDWGGGEFELHPRVDDNALYLPSPEAPGYRLAITGASPEALERFGKALVSLARKQRNADDENEEG